jgi:hypothetical protein
VLNNSETRLYACVCKYNTLALCMIHLVKLCGKTMKWMLKFRSATKVNIDKWWIGRAKRIAKPKFVECEQ